MKLHQAKHLKKYFDLVKSLDQVRSLYLGISTNFSISMTWSPNDFMASLLADSNCSSNSDSVMAILIPWTKQCSNFFNHISQKSSKTKIHKSDLFLQTNLTSCTRFSFSFIGLYLRVIVKFYLIKIIFPHSKNMPTLPPPPLTALIITG